MDREKYYVNIASGEISKTLVGDNRSFVIYASMDEIRQLRYHLDRMDEASFGSFWRAHVPFKPYHEDPENDQYDTHIEAVYTILYNCGTEDGREHISSLNIINTEHNKE